MKQEHELWYARPAGNWSEALPLGNGRLGAMVFGGASQDRLQLNEDTLYSGKPVDRINPAALSELPKVRKLLAEDRVEEAELLAQDALSAMPRYNGAYQPLCDLFIRTPEAKVEQGSYRRSLDLSEGVAHTRYAASGVNYARTYFASLAHGVLAIRLRADKPGALAFAANLMRRPFDSGSYVSEAGDIVMAGEASPGGVGYACAVRVCCAQGTRTAFGDAIRVRDAQEAWVFVAAATTYRYEDPVQACEKALDALKPFSFDQLMEAHQKAYRALYGRVSFALEGPDFTHLPTDERRAQFASNRADVRFCELLFHYSRYLLIAGGAPGSHALNLQGLWNDSFTPPWESIYTININIEMIYWPVYLMNLPELTGPLHELIQKMREPGQRAAQSMYGCRGFVGHHNTNLWGDCAPNGAGVYQWPFGAAWMCLHLMEYHRFFGDVEFVREEAYPLLRDAVLFFLDYLQEDKDGYLVTNLTQSPENRYRLPDGQEGMIARTCTMDDAILCALFDDFLEAEALLGISGAFSEAVRAARGKIRPYRIGSKGQLLEWAEEHEEVEPGHRHFSHLFALHPGRQITPEATPELAQACRQTLALRMAHGSGHTGWSRAWMINQFARLHEGDMAWMHVQELAVSSLYPNLMAAHPPFQMDGNSGYAAGIVEMLVQSHEGVIRLMPGAFTTLPDGRIEGIRTRGGFVLDLAWRNGKPSSLRLLATRDQPCRLSAPVPFQDMGTCAWSGDLAAGETREFVFAEA